ncbi:hypothetical protein O7R08_15595 [Vibrio alginolyticus]|uniref:hypothetical protein n=1 Tax=Vibrio alginolyticus TaxID=663 RepID=UPI0022DDB8F2|nr:hypothetical protein [Vibrio alginolyticus]MDA0407363.1 hypothetical protein [Vibrio alginolyticus]
MEISKYNSKRVRLKLRFWQPFINSMIYFFGLTLLLAFSALVIHLEVRYIIGISGENSIIEYFQEVYLFISGSLFLVVAIRHNNQRGFAFLISAFFYIMLIRELDGLFDQISHGFWKYPAWLLTIFVFIYTFFNIKTTVEQLTNYTNHKSFSLMLAGVATLLVFSRLYGMSELWQGIMQENYIRSVKNLAEEGVELMAYSLIVFASVWYCLPRILK